MTIGARALLRPLLPLAARLRRLWWRVRKPDLRGVRAIVTDPAGRVLLIRHSYGNTGLWRLPGGGAKRGESAADAAMREVREECGLYCTDLAPFGRFVGEQSGAVDRITVFTARAAGEPMTDGFEVAEVRWWRVEALPTLSPATARRLDEWAGRRAPNGRW